ncbi:hypothetical protein [Williamsia sp.]|uniref:hypothetical protein n=1 Tax=Williamsia sp. TaxID=1872085 RepID=UPI002F9413D8
MPEIRPRSTIVVTLLCIAGLAVAGVALAYCVHLGAQRDDDTGQSAAEFTYIPPNQAGLAADDVTPESDEVPEQLDTVRSKIMLCTIDKIGTDVLSVHTPDGRKHQLTLSPDTHVESAKGNEVADLTTGDLVVVRVIESDTATTVDLIVDGRVSSSIPDN